MRDISTFNKIYLASAPVDFRKQAHGLSVIVENTFKKPATNEKYLFAFTNKRKNAVKLLYWDSTGYALWWKVLEKDRFHWPRNDEDVSLLHPRDLKWLLEGIDLSTINKHRKIIL